MNLRTRYNRLTFWNKFAFWGSLASIVALVLWGYDHWSASRHDQEFAPARKAVAASIARCYTALFYAAEYVVAPERGSGQQVTSLDEKYARTKWFLTPVEQGLADLQTVVVRNNVALDSSLVTFVSAFSDDARSLHRQLTFFAELHDPQMAGCDIVSEGPFATLTRLAALFHKLRDHYPDIRVAENLKSPEELEALWTDVAKKEDRLLLRPETYEWKRTRRPLVFDSSNLVRLAVPTDPSLKGVAQVFDLRQ